MQYDVFLSHNRKQKPWVRDFVTVLRKGGLRVFFDEDSIKAGEQIVWAIGKGIEQSKYVVLIISPASIGVNGSKWVAMEAAMTVYSDPDASNNKLIPIILEDCDSIPLPIKSLNCINLTDPSTRDTNLKNVIKHLGIQSNINLTLPLWSISDNTSQNSLTTSLSIADITNVHEWGWNGHKLLDELIRIDYETIDGLTEIHEGNTEQWAPVFMDHPDTWRLLIYGNKQIVGYWHFVPLFEKEHKLAKNGKFMESHITSDTVKCFELPGLYDIYVVSICLDCEYRRTIAFQLLFDSLMKVLLDLANNGVFIREIVTNAYTPSGISLAKSLGMTYHTDHIDKGKIYVSRIKQLLNHGYWNRYIRLLTLYENGA